MAIKLEGGVKALMACPLVEELFFAASLAKKVKKTTIRKLLKEMNALKSIWVQIISFQIYFLYTFAFGDMLSKN